MTEFEHGDIEHHEAAIIDPIDYLLKAEELIDAGNLKSADAVLAKGIEHLTNKLLLDDIDDPADRADLARLLVGLHYTRADSLRVRSAVETNPDVAARYYNLALADLAILQEFNKDNLTFVSPLIRPNDSDLCNNALIYLITRSRGFLALHHAQSRKGDVEFTGRTLAIAYQNLYAADEALASGIHREPPLAPPRLPVPATIQDEAEKEAATAAYTQYKAEIQSINVERRGQRRVADPDLAAALRATTTQLNSRVEEKNSLIQSLIQKMRERRLPQLPDFSVPGKKVSDVFEITR